MSTTVKKMLAKWGYIKENTQKSPSIEFLKIYARAEIGGVGVVETMLSLSADDTITKVVFDHYRSVMVGLEADLVSRGVVAEDSVFGNGEDRNGVSMRHFILEADPGFLVTDEREAREGEKVGEGTGAYICEIAPGGAVKRITTPTPVGLY